MAKYYGNIGYGVEEEVKPGVYDFNIVEKPYYGDVLRNSRSLDTTQYKNDNIVINNSFSIIADAFALNNFHNIKYIEYLGTKWEVKSVEVQHPRLILSAGGVWNG